MSETSEPNSFADVEQLKRALLQFLAERADWGALSKELTSLAKSPSGPDDAATRQSWLVLADFLKHSTGESGVPPQVRRFLKSDEAARAAEAAFGEMLSQRQKWLNFANELKRPRSRGD